MSDAPSTERLGELFAQWQACQPLKPEDERRLWKKLRLDWNYHSNRIEGNTLTYGETELLLIHGQTHGSHLLRDFEEMKAHDMAIHRLRDHAREGRPIAEAEIRTLNEIILKEPFWSSALTSEGEPTRKLITPGRYKEQPNSVRTATDELFEFAQPIDVPARMAALVQKLNTIFEVNLALLLKLLAETHHDFLLIHPFDDGNGRVARLILNYILLRRDMLPIAIPAEEKTLYLSVLRQADVKIFSPLIDYLRCRLETTLELGIRVSKGEEIRAITPPPAP